MWLSTLLQSVLLFYFFFFFSNCTIVISLAKLALYLFYFAFEMSGKVLIFTVVQGNLQIVCR